MGQNDSSALCDAVRLEYIFILSFFNIIPGYDKLVFGMMSIIHFVLSGSKPRQFVELNTKDWGH